MSINQDIIIAIDGFSSCGKSTLAKDLALLLNYKYLDSGAMYRAVTLYCLDNNLDISNPNEIINNLSNIHIHFENLDGKNSTFLNNQNVEEDIREMRVSAQVSEVSVIPEVRTALVKLQKEIGKNKGIVMDGRDITSVVFPDAELKIFVTADVEVRAQRRFNELVLNGKTVTIDSVRSNLLHRDKIDTTRNHSPLIKVEGAFLIDNTFLNRKEQLLVALKFKEFITK